MKRILTGTVAATVLAVAMTAGATSAEAHRRWHGSGWGGAAVGVGAGLIIGSALAQPRYAPGYYVDEDEVYAPPPRVIYREAPRRAPIPRCQTYLKYDYQGRPFEWTDCN